MKKHIILILTLFLCGVYSKPCTIRAQRLNLASFPHGLDYEVKAGINMGGTSPLTFLPIKKRSLDNYSLTCHYTVRKRHQMG